MKLDFFAEFADPYMQTPSGRGVFLCGITLGMIAWGQNKANIQDAPMFKQLNFGRLQKRDILKQMAKIPQLLRAYDMDYQFLIQELAAKAGETALMGKEENFGIHANFAFTVGFLNSKAYFWKIFDKKQ